MNNEAPSLQDLQQEVDQWITTTGVRYFNELTNLAILTEEVGELARIIARRSDHRPTVRRAERKGIRPKRRPRR